MNTNQEQVPALQEVTGSIRLWGVGRCGVNREGESTIMGDPFKIDPFKIETMFPGVLYESETKRILLGLVLAVAVMFPHPDATAGQAPVNLGTASRFAVLAASEITSVPTSAIKGDVGISPSARSRIAGLEPVEVTGSIFAADDGGAIAVMLTQAQGDLTTAYNDAAGRTLAPVDVANADLGGQTLAPGLYKSTGTLAITGNLTLDAQGDPNAVFIFQVVSSLNTAPGSQVILSGGANAANIYWQVGTSATLGTTTIFKGTIMADQSISLATGATLDGRALARIAAVTLDANTITKPTLRPTPPSFGAIRRAADGSVTLVITNTPGLPLTIETSSDLTSWTKRATFTPTISPEDFTITNDSTTNGTGQGLLRQRVNNHFGVLSGLNEGQRLSGIKIGVDPGHGGDLPGAIGPGPNGVKEKDVNLTTALALKKYLEADGATVFITRTTDETIPPPENDSLPDPRTDLFVNNNVDLAISVHHNSVGDSSINTTMVFIYCDCSLATRGDLASKVVQRLATSTGIPVSQTPAGNDTRCDGHPDYLTGLPGVGQANLFMVRRPELKGKIPSILAEISFLSHSAEQEKLRDTDYLDKNGWAIYAGVADYYGFTPIPRAESKSFYRAFYSTLVADEIDPHLVIFNRYTAGGSVSSWISAGCVAAGVPANSAWITGYETAIGRESSGDANACNIWDRNATEPSGYNDVADWGNAWPESGSIYQLDGALTPFGCSRGVAQCIPQTFATYHAAGTSLNIYDPGANIAASINYVRQIYGVSADGSDLASKVQQFDPNRPPKGY